MNVRYTLFTNPNIPRLLHSHKLHLLHLGCSIPQPQPYIFCTLHILHLGYPICTHLTYIAPLISYSPTLHILHLGYPIHPTYIYCTLDILFTHLTYITPWVSYSSHLNLSHLGYPIHPFKPYIYRTLDIPSNTPNLTSIAPWISFPPL